jgi:hypothetical protein
MPFLTEPKLKMPLDSRASLSARQLLSQFPGGWEDRSTSLPPYFQKYISQNQAWEGEKPTVLTYTLPHKRESICPIDGNPSPFAPSSSEEIVPTPFPPKAWRELKKTHGACTSPKNRMNLPFECLQHSPARKRFSRAGGRSPLPTVGAFDCGLRSVRICWRLSPW